MIRKQSLSYKNNLYVAPSSKVFGRGELVLTYSKIALRYFSKGFWLDFIAALPLPQVLIWIIIPTLRGSTMANTKNVLRFFIIFQYIPRLYLIFPLSSQIVKATGVVTETAWAGAAYNLMLYMLASHILGACWYLLSIERQEACWKSVCNMEKSNCQYGFFNCHSIKDAPRVAWFIASNVTNLCSPNAGFYPFGIYADAMTSKVTSSPVVNPSRDGFFNSCRIGPGDFCGEELLTWALDPRPSVILPSSTRTVKAFSEVEAFALIAEDLKFVASQFRRLHSKQLRHKFRFYSHQWRTWAACFIQAAWRRHKKRKEAAELRAKESLVAASEAENEIAKKYGKGFVVYGTRVARSTRKGVNMHSGTNSGVVSSLQKPTEPDFSDE
ncbi:protein CNGC15c [Medicago truncatula]|uniref:protein CNGC15c n=1 Tax=Medicago truncatula TaxID=3880 RepID=UPI0019677DCE|nr:protein CNGC15c [Medicago truncatula]